MTDYMASTKNQFYVKSLAFEIIMKTLRIFNKLTSLFIPVFTYTYNFQKSFEALNVHDIWYQTPNKKFIFLAQFKK